MKNTNVVSQKNGQQASPAFVKSVARALAIIEYVVNSSMPPSFTMIQTELELPKSSLSYLLQELVSKQYLQFDSQLKVYYPGLQLIKIGASCINNTNFSNELWRGIKQLSEEVGETTHAVILEDRFVIYIAKHRGAREVSAVANIGFKLPAHATAGGKMLLSSLADSELERRYAGVELERHTECTITDFAKLKTELAQIRQQGYATDNQGNVPGGFCVAAPVYDNTEKMLAAISISVLAAQITDEYLQLLIEKVKTTARNISIRLGKV